MPLLIPPLIALVLFVALGALGIRALVEVSRRMNPALRDPARPALPGPVAATPAPPPPRPTRTPAPRPPAAVDPDADLLRYPRQLEALEDQLEQSLDALTAQLTHLHARHEAIAQKSGREELAARYAEDLALLSRREAGMRRVMGLVWKARALLTLRAHVAASARRRPELPALPPVDDPATDLEAAARLYTDAATAVRAFEKHLQARLRALPEAVPQPPARADIADALRADVEAEERRVSELYVNQSEAVDRLADTLAYLADRSRTRRVVQGTAPAVGAASSESLVNEVERALGQLQDLADAGDRRLADLAVQNLAEDISQLERAGLEAQAEADAALEVARLLEQF